MMRNQIYKVKYEDQENLMKNSVNEDEENL